MLLVGKDLASYTLAAGEPFVLEVQLLDSAGRATDLDDQAMVLTFYTAGTRALVTDYAGAPSQYEGERLSDTTGEYFRWAFDGRWSEAMLSKPGLRVELAQRLFYGRSIISTGTLSVVNSSAVVPSLPGGSIALTAVRVSIKANAVLGGAPQITQTVILYDGPSVPIPAPAFTTPSSIASDGTPQVGELLTGIDGVATNALSYTRRWLLGSTLLTSSATYTPTAAGSYRYETIATGPGGDTTSGSNITVAAATVTPTLALSPTSPSLASNAAAGTLVSSISNVPSGVSPSVTPNDGRLVIAGDASAGWKVVVGMSALSAGTVNFSVAATGATGASGVLTITAAGTAPYTVMFVGSSTPERYFTVAGGPANPDVSTSLSGTTFAAATSSSAGRGAKVFGDYLQQTLGRPIRLLGRGKSGSRVSNWNDDGDTTRSNAVSAALAAGGVDAIVFILGFNDADKGTSLTASQHTTALRSLFSKLRTELGKPNLPIIMGMSQKSGEVKDASADSRFNALYAAENAVLSDANVYFGAHAYDLPQIDGIHMEEPQYDIHGLRLARNTASMLLGQPIARGPSVATIASLSPTETEVNFTHSTGTDFTPASGSTGFRVSTDGFANLLAISAAARMSATKLKLMHTAAAAGATLSLDLLANANPDRSNPVRDNSVGTLPINPTPSTLTATVAAGTGTPLSISGTNTAATVGTSPAFTPAISGGTAPYTLSLFSGTLPPGRAVSGLSVTGTYTTAGSYSYVLRVTDSVGATANLSVGPVVVSAASTTAFSDTFTGTDGTNLTAHTSDSGHSWTAVSGTILIGGNTAYGTGNTAYLSSFVPTSANYTVKAKIKFLTLISGYQIYVLGRASAPGGTRTHYSLGYLQGGASGEGIYLGKVVSGGSFTVFGFFPYTAVAGTAPELGLVMVGDQISATLDGNVIIAPVTDTSIAAAGTVGLRTTATAALTTGPHYDDLTVA